MITAIPDDHQQIRGTIASLRALLVEDGLPIGHWLAAMRWSLTRQVLRHFSEQAQAAGDVEQDYRRHLAEWTPGTIDAEWPRYCREMRAILDAIEDDIDAGARDIDRPPPRAAAASVAR